MGLADTPEGRELLDSINKRLADGDTLFRDIRAELCNINKRVGRVDTQLGVCLRWMQAFGKYRATEEQMSVAQTEVEHAVAEFEADLESRLIQRAERERENEIPTSPINEKPTRDE